jgi:hypothetical protein
MFDWSILISWDVHPKFNFLLLFFGNEPLWLALHKKKKCWNFGRSVHSKHRNIMCLNILSTSIGSKRTTLSTRYETNWGAIGNMLRNMMETHCELDGNTFRCLLQGWVGGVLISNYFIKSICFWGLLAGRQVYCV